MRLLYRLCLSRAEANFKLEMSLSVRRSYLAFKMVGSLFGGSHKKVRLKAEASAREKLIGRDEQGENRVVAISKVSSFMKVA